MAVGSQRQAIQQPTEHRSRKRQAETHHRARLPHQPLETPATDRLQQLVALANNSPRTAQLQSLQELANHSPRATELRQLQALATSPKQSKETEPPGTPQIGKPTPNRTGLPDALKSGIEALSGLSMDQVRVHYNSAQPARLNALAYAQGSDIHLAPGQEQHLPHEAWHVVQQAQGRVRPTLQMKDGVQVNDDAGLEREADVMGSKALEGGHRVAEAHRSISMPMETAQTIKGDATNCPDKNVANNGAAPLANGRGSAKRGGNEIQRMADQRPEAALQRQVQAWGDGSERVGQLRAWQEVADGRGVGGKRQESAVAGAASAHQAATASREETSQQRADRTRRTSADPQRAQQGTTAAAAAAPAALDSLSRLQQLADASPQVAQLRRLQALADGDYTPVAQLAGGPEEEKLVQGKCATAQPPPQLQQATRAINNGLPDQIKSGIESLSGLTMDQVQVHYNSDKPAQLSALAYARGSDIHLAAGQEAHLPHEAWHVVQQAQGRVKPTLQMKGDVPVNDDAGLEREADAMGARAMSLGAGAAPVRTPVGPAAPKPQQATAQMIFVKLQESRSSKKGKGNSRYVVARSDEGNALDTTEMPLETRRDVLADLKNASKNTRVLTAIEELTAEINSMVNPVNEKQIIDMTTMLEKLSFQHALSLTLSDQNRLLLNRLAFQMLKAMEFLGNFDESEKDAPKFRTLLLANLEKIHKIDANVLSTSRELVGGQADLRVIPEEIDAYREDIRNGSGWGGGAEAGAIAQALRFHVDLLMLDSENKYVRVGSVGDTGGTASEFSLLNTGNHYVVVGNGYTTGTEFLQGHVVFNPAGNGDCMFNSLYYALSNNGLTPLLHPTTNVAMTEDAFATEARVIAADGITDLQGQLSVEEILMSGQRAGVGKNLWRFVELKKYSGDKLNSLIKKSDLMEDKILSHLKKKRAIKPSSNKSLQSLLNIYDQREQLANSATDKEKKEKVFADAEKLLDCLLELIFSSNLKSPELLDESGEGQSEQQLRKAEIEKFRRLYTVTPSPHSPGQWIVTVDKIEFVVDRIGQLVPRKVSRSISEQNISELKNYRFIFPSKDSPVKFSGSAGGSGISDNHVRPATLEMLHVEGLKPSPFLSTTREPEGTNNPEGDSFGSALYEIDLAYAPANAIADLSTTRGISFFMLKNYVAKSGGPSKSDLIRQAKDANDRQGHYLKAKKDHKSGVSGAKKPAEYNAQVKAQENTTLSGKEWQALMDVVRTSEVLINCKLQAEALAKKN